jgi:RHS repeat-associated protein
LLGYTSSGELSATNGAHTFLYSSDHTGRLITSTAGFNSTTWSYDVLGNRLTENMTSTAVGSCLGLRSLTYAADNRVLTRGAIPGLPSCGQASYFTDQAGRRLGEGDPSAGGTAKNQLRSLMTYTASGELFYSLTGSGASPQTWDHLWNWSDAEGRRVMTHQYTSSNIYPIPSPDTLTGTRSFYVYDGPNVSIEITRGAGGVWRVPRRHVMLGVDEEVAGRYLVGATKNLFMVNDRQGTMVKAIEASGNNQGTGLIRGSFGERQGLGAAGGNTAASGFTGAQSPSQAGYAYLRNRWYDPTSGRFLTQDPIGLAGGVNLYAYAGNNPVGFSDPYGLCERPLGKGVGICVQSFIGAKTVGGLPVGDNRGPRGDGGSYKTSQRFSVDPASGAQSGYQENVGATMGTVGIGGFSISPSRPTEGGGFTVSVSGNAMSVDMPPGADITYSFDIHVSADGKVSVTGGEFDGYPSFEIYAYGPDGNARRIAYYPEGNITALGGDTERKVVPTEPR